MIFTGSITFLPSTTLILSSGNTVIDGLLATGMAGLLSTAATEYEDGMFLYCIHTIIT